ncbi:MAG: hypothetical protein AAGD32_04190 [Planctomycetota bacterium]
MEPWGYKFRRKTCLSKLAVATGLIGIGGAAAVFLPAGAAAGAVALGGAAAGEALGGIGGNLFASIFERWFPDDSLTATEKLNHDVELVVGKTIEGVMRTLVREGSPHAKLYEHLLKYEVAAEWRGMLIKHDVASDLELPDPQGLLVAAAEARESGTSDKLPPCLDETTWRRWLVKLAPHLKHSKGFGDSLDELAPALVERFHWHLVEALKHDFANDGQAYAAIQLATSHATLALARQQKQQLSDLKLKLDNIEQHVTGRASIIAAVRLDEQQFKQFADAFAEIGTKLDTLLHLAQEIAKEQAKHTKLIDTNARLVGMLDDAGKETDALRAERDRLYELLKKAELEADAGDTAYAAALAAAEREKNVNAILALLVPAHDDELERVRRKRTAEAADREHENHNLVTGCLRIIEQQLVTLAFAAAQQRLLETLTLTGDEFVLLAHLARTHLALHEFPAAIDVLQRAQALVNDDRSRAWIACEIGNVENATDGSAAALRRGARHRPPHRRTVRRDATGATRRRKQSPAGRVLHGSDRAQGRRPRRPSGGARHLHPTRRAVRRDVGEPERHREDTAAHRGGRSVAVTPTRPDDPCRRAIAVDSRLCPFCPPLHEVLVVCRHARGFGVCARQDGTSAMEAGTTGRLARAGQCRCLAG